MVEAFCTSDVRLELIFLFILFLLPFRSFVWIIYLWSMAICPSLNRLTYEQWLIDHLSSCIKFHCVYLDLKMYNLHQISPIVYMKYVFMFPYSWIFDICQSLWYEQFGFYYPIPLESFKAVYLWRWTQHCGEPISDLLSVVL